jgi:hypothetical protein
MSDVLLQVEVQIKTLIATQQHLGLRVAEPSSAIHANK